MQTQLIDVIHLYLGCEIRFHSNLTGTWGIWNKMTCSDIELATVHIGFGEKFQILLRPLSSMTEEEICVLDETEIGDERRLTLDEFRQSQVESPFYSPDEYLYLLSKHFDLFNLLPSAQALDADTVLKQLK